MKILICDDSAVARKLITRSIVQDTSLHLLEAQDGHEALKILTEQNIDVLFLDLTMPVMDGYETLEVIRKEDLPIMVIVVSGDIQPEARDRVKKLGAIDFVKKPVDQEKITAVLQDYGLIGGEQ